MRRLPMSLDGHSVSERALIDWAKAERAAIIEPDVK